MKLNFLLLASIAGMLAVSAGALGAHLLESLIEPARLDAFETAVRYLFYHVFGLLAIHILDPYGKRAVLRRSGYFFLAGMVCFSGSLFILSTQEISGINAAFLGPVTPAGGLLLIIGWLHLAYFALVQKRDRES